MAVVKSPFALITDDGRRFEFDAGEQHIPAEIADHWYVKAHCEVPCDEPVSMEAVEAQEPIAEDEQSSERRKPGRPKKS